MNSATQLVKAELAGAPITAMIPLPARRAEASTMLRIGDAFRTRTGGLSLEVVYDSQSAALRLRGEIISLYSYTPLVSSLGDGFTSMRLVQGAAALAAAAGLLDGSGRVISGINPDLLDAGFGVATAALRGAFLARGQMVELGSQMWALELGCPTVPAIGMLRELLRGTGFRAVGRCQGKSIEPPAVVAVRGNRQVSDLLTAMGAPAAAWALIGAPGPGRKMNATARERAEAFNRSRSALAADRSAVEALRALELLGEDVPPHLAEMAQLRLNHRSATLSELARMVDPPVTKNVVAGRLRTLKRIAAGAAEDAR